MLGINVARRFIVGLLCVALAIAGCTTAQLQKKYTAFDSCFREEKKTAMLLGALAGGIAGAAAGGGGKSSAAAGIALAAMGAIIGNRVAWQGCLAAFPVQSQTSVVNDRASAMVQSGMTQTQVVTKSLTVQNVSAGPLVFGKDLNVSVTYRYLSDNPAARDVKARVFRNLLFKAPDGSQQEVPSNTEDTIQQGVSRATFAIPTPSIADAKELADTTNWVFKFAVEVDGMRQEQTVALNVPQLSVGNSSPNPSPAIVPTSTTVPNAPAVASPPTGQKQPAIAPSVETINLRQGTVLFKEANSPTVVVRLPTTQPVTVLQRTVQGNFNWVQVRLSDGKEGWFRGTAR